MTLSKQFECQKSHNLPFRENNSEEKFMRYFIQLGFDGTNYHGWQKQKSTEATVQNVVERALHKILKKDIVVYGCGRTDTGVHSSQYVIHINLDSEPSFDLKFRLNKTLPNSIAVFEVFLVSDRLHARYSARLRTYDYFIHLNKDPILSKYSTFCEHMILNVELMKKVVELLLKTKDFKAVAKRPDLYDNTLCQVSSCQLFYHEEQSRLRFTITSNRFLRGMVRFCVYYILEVGSGRLSFGDFEKILKQKKVIDYKRPAPPNGLFLSKVEYPSIELKDMHPMIKMLKLGLE